MAKKPVESPWSSEWIRKLFDGESSAHSKSTSLIIPKQGPTDEDSLIKLVDEALSFKTSVAPDLRIDDRDLKEAPNFHAFCMAPHGLGMKPYARQAYLE